MGPYRCEALTSTGRRCKCQAESCVTVAPGKEYLACRQHAKATAVNKPDKPAEVIDLLALRARPMEVRQPISSESSFNDSLERLYTIGYNCHD